MDDAEFDLLMAEAMERQKNRPAWSGAGRFSAKVNMFNELYWGVFQFKFDDREFEAKLQFQRPNWSDDIAMIRKLSSPA